MMNLLAETQEIKKIFKIFALQKNNCFILSEIFAFRKRALSFRDTLKKSLQKVLLLEIISSNKVFSARAVTKR